MVWEGRSRETPPYPGGGFAKSAVSPPHPNPLPKRGEGICGAAMFGAPPIDSRQRGETGAIARHTPTSPKAEGLDAPAKPARCSGWKFHTVKE